MRLDLRLFAVLFAMTMAVGQSPALAQDAVPSQADWASARQSITVSDGFDMSYVELGASDGLPVILIHGFTDSSRAWSFVAPYLGDYRLIAVELRGHGGTDVSACCYSPAAMAIDLNNFMNAMGIEQADIVGHSFGANAAAGLAAYFPDRVRRVVLAAAGVALPAPAVGWLMSTIAEMDFPLEPEGEFMSGWISAANADQEDYAKQARTEASVTPKDTWVGVLRASAATDWSTMAGLIKTPILILWGDQDQLFPATTQETLRAALPDAKYVTFAGIGHSLTREDPEAVAAAINDFLSLP